jgi:hypothetical protein
MESAFIMKPNQGSRNDGINTKFKILAGHEIYRTVYRFYTIIGYALDPL